MLGVDRRRQLYDHVRTRRSAKVTDLARALAVSSQTVRRDLAHLEDEGLVTRVHGGAIAVDAAMEVDALQRAGRHLAEKRRIGQAAARLVEPGSTVFISGGTTTEQLVPFLEGIRGLTAVTNALNVATALARCPEVEVIVLSGYLRHSELTLLGRMAEESVGELHIAHAFYGCFGVDPDAGLTGASLAEVSTDCRIIAAAGRLTALADHTKFHQRGPVRLAATERMSTLVTDRGAPPEGVRALEDHGVEVVLA